MSTEAPRNSGQGEPVPPQRSKDGFSGLLRRLFIAPTEPQPTQQSISRIVQPPPGLEGFATGLKQGIDSHFTSVKQQELDRQNAEASRLSAEAAKQAQEEVKKKELAGQERIRREEAIAEANKILENFRIRERLEYIRDTVWEGKGEVMPIEPNSDCFGGFDLVHKFPSFTKQEETLSADRHGTPNYRWRYVPKTDSVHFRISALGNSRLSIYSYLLSDRFEEDSPRSGVDHKTWGGYSWQHDDDPRGIRYSHHGAEAVDVQTDLPESETLLQAAITQVIVDRIKRGVLPAQLEQEAREQRSRLPHWQQWNKQFSNIIYREQHPPNYNYGD